MSMLVLACILSAALALQPDVALGTIAIPTPGQVRYQQAEIIALTHFNMATFLPWGDPACTHKNWNVSGNPATFAPTQLDTDNWAESYVALGAGAAVLTAKHGCGFCLWNTEAALPDGSTYAYRSDVDIVAMFVDSCKRAGIGHGFYYSLDRNVYLNVQDRVVQNTTVLPGQVKVTQAQFEQIAMTQLKELWGNYGNLTEIWFDGGYSDDMKGKITEMLQALQPEAAGGGPDVTKNPTKWVGTESGLAPYPIWSLGCDSGQGDPDSPLWCPTVEDTTLQYFDMWFYIPNLAIRTLPELIDVYHHSVGQNAVLELDFAIDRTGRVAPAHAVRYKQFGDWIRSCYGNPIASMAGTGVDELVITLPAAVSVDRIMIQEDIVLGQRVREYTVEVQTPTSDWTLQANGTSVGHKRIQLFSSPVTVSALRLRVTAVAAPHIVNFAVFAPEPCAAQ